MKLRPFEGARAKLERAKHLLQELAPALQESAKNCVLLYREEGYIFARANLPRESFIRFAVLTGEIVHQTRSALEHAKMDCRQNRMAMEFFESPERNEPLYELAGLWDKDKHRLLNLAVFYPYGIQLTLKRNKLSAEFPNTFEHKMFQLDVLSEDGEELFRELDPGPEIEVQTTIAYAGFALEGTEPVQVPVILPGESEPRGYAEEVPQLVNTLAQFIDLAEQTIDRAEEVLIGQP